ncbi:putative ribonuclease H-like domain-containing protein [Tanacetum coccineum]
MSKSNDKKERKPTWNNVQRVNKQNQFVPLAVHTRTKNNPVNTAKASSTNNFSTARQKVNREIVLTSTALKVNTVKPIMNGVRPANVFNKTHSPSSRPFKRTTVLKTNFSNQKVYTAKVKQVSTVGVKWDTAVKASAGCDNPHRTLKNKGIIDSGCSRHMTGNKAYLADFQDFNGGPVAFGGSKGYITGKGKIKTGKLDFEDVSFVKELQPFNLFSVSQMCDKKNKVLFTDSECLVLSPDFKDQEGYSNAKLTNKMEFAERRTGPLLKAARTMLADSFLPNTFWAQAVSTACYVLNKVLVTKPHNKTPYELLTWKGPNWLFDLDYLTDSMNYHSVRSENQANLHAGQQESNQNTGTKDKIGAGDSEKEVETDQDCFELPIWHSYSSTKKGGAREEEQVFLDELERLQRQEKEANEEAEALRKNLEQETENLVTQAGAAKSSSTNIFSTDSSTAKASGTNLVNTVSIPVSTASTKSTNSQKDDSEIPPLEDIHEDATDGIFTHSSYDDEGAVADFTNLETVVNVSPIPISRTHPSHPSALILGDPTSVVQTRSKVNKSSEAHAFRFQKLLEDEAGLILQEELLQFEIQKIDEDWYMFSTTRFPDPKYQEKSTTKWLKICIGYIKLKKDVQVYVDDIIFGSTKKSWCDEFEALMKSRFQMSSMGELTFFLGLQVKQKPDGIFISQDKYVAEILKKFDFASVKTASTPIETQKPLVKDEEASDVDVHLYRSMIGSLMYVTASRPDIMFAVCACSRFSCHSKTSHFKCYHKEFLSDYAGANLDRKSTTGGCQFLGRRLITWQCKKQTIVATSTTEAEYVAAASCCGQFKSKKIAQVVRAWIQSKNSLVKHFEDMSLYRPFKEYLHVWFNPPRDVSMSCLTTKGMHTIGAVCTRRFRESLRRVTDGAEAFLILTLFILCLDKVSTTCKGRKLANISVPLDHFPVNSLTSKVFSFMIKKGKHFSGKVTPLFDTMLVQPTQDEGASSERLSVEQPSPSPAPINESLHDSSSAQPSEEPFEQQPEPSPRPSPRPSPTPSPCPIVPDSIPEPTGENLGDHSSNDESFSGNEDDMTLLNVLILYLFMSTEYLKIISLQQIFPKKRFSKKQRVHIKSVSKQGRKKAKEESEVHRDPLFDVMHEDKIDHMETENAHSEARITEIVSTVGIRVSTDEQVEGTEESNESSEEIFESTEKQREASQTSTQTPTSMTFGDDETIATLLINMSKAKAASKEKEKGVELKDVEEIDRPRPTSTRSLLTLKPLPKIDPKDKGKKKIEEEE